MSPRPLIRDGRAARLWEAGVGAGVRGAMGEGQSVKTARSDSNLSTPSFALSLVFSKTEN